MKKVFLINFSSPILVASIKKMQKDDVITVQYWSAYREGFEEIQKDKANLPNVITHHMHDLIKGVPPEGLDVDDFAPIDQDSIEQCYEYGWQALAMMGRSDFNNTTFVQKRNIYYRYLKFWNGMIKKFNPDCVLFYDIPHGGVDFALYGLARALGVKTLILHPLTIESRVLIMQDYKESSLELKREYDRCIDNAHTIEDLPVDLQEYYNRQINSNMDATPAYSKRAMQNRAPLSLSSPIILARNLFRKNIFKTLYYFLQMFFTRRQAGTFHENILGIKMKWRMISWQRQNERVKKEYIQLQERPDLKKKFIYFPLHFQPEQSTLPMGGAYDDQLLAIEMLSKSLPNNWVVYVKEISLQWRPSSTESHLYRYPGYYRAIARLSNVSLVPVSISSFELINHSQAVATITGTAGWEAVLRSKPAILFGYNWYQYCDGVIPVRTFESCILAFKKIIQGYAPSTQKVINFLYALGNVSAMAPYYKARYFSFSGVLKKEDAIHNITKLITTNLN